MARSANVVLGVLVGMLHLHAACGFCAPLLLPAERFLKPFILRMTSEPPKEADWREFRARLVKQQASSTGPTRHGAPRQAETPQEEEDYWSHELVRAEPGCLLLANPVKFRGLQSYFSRAVVILVEHDDSIGSVGFLLNRKTPFTVGDVAPSLGIFAACQLHIGGPVGDGLQFIHQLAGVHGSEEIMKGVFYGGDLAHAAYLLARHPHGKHLASRFLFFYKYCSWGPRQLAEELLNTTIGAPLDPPSPVWHIAGKDGNVMHVTQAYGVPVAAARATKLIETDFNLTNLNQTRLNNLTSQHVPACP